MDWKELLLTVITSAAGSAVLIGAIAYLSKTWITERLKASIKYDYDIKLESLKADLQIESEHHLAQLKSEIDRSAERLRAAALSFTEVQKATITRKIEAIDGLWEAVRTARTHIPGVIFLTDYLTGDELKDMAQYPKLGELRRELDALSSADIALKFFLHADNARPHVGEYVWALFVTFHGIMARVIFILQGKPTRGDRRWYQDDSVLRMIESGFGNERRTLFEALAGQRLEWLRREFEKELFKSFEQLLTGRSFSEAALNQAFEMEQLAAKVHAEHMLAKADL
ncbi:hypothetical protein [uncultured Pseudomonas sp.]|uniref:hypothetical protein n=1 Tax=uncultured Pseudomonas sp. TaxID=114707 RepID=UPI002585F759|nr:hypothetical protein [uncultured Pseudomonas sp.]